MAGPGARYSGRAGRLSVGACIRPVGGRTNGVGRWPNGRVSDVATPIKPPGGFSEITKTKKTKTN